MTAIENANSKKTKSAEGDKKTTDKSNSDNKNYSSDIAALMDRKGNSDDKKSD